MMEGIEIELELEAGRNTIRADPNQLQQVFVNVLINAADVFTEGGIPKEREKKLVIKSRIMNEEIEISFTDNGTGIPLEQLDHIFDPFYTTKDPGKGTGLGLSVSYRIVEGLNGKIYAESELGKGTTVVVRLPIDSR
jgi:two-component system cell cycle sensor histidine kinase/response regulator CckA